MDDENNRGQIPSMGPIQSMGQIKSSWSQPKFSYSSQTINSSKTGILSTLSWLLDTEFRDIRINSVARFFCKSNYIFWWIITILGGISSTFLIFYGAVKTESLILLLAIPCIWILIFVFMFFVRLYLESVLIVFDWIVETTKAAKIYIESKDTK